MVLFFIREDNGMQYRSHASRLGRLYEQFKGAEMIEIPGEDIETAHTQAQSARSPFPILADPDRAVYQLYELEKYIVLSQRTASIVVEREGVVRYIKRTTGPMVWLQESRELYGFVESLNEMHRINPWKNTKPHRREASSLFMESRFWRTLLGAIIIPIIH